MMHSVIINSLDIQTQQQPSSQEEPDATEQGVEHERESHHVSIDTTPQVHHFRDYSEPRSHHTRLHDRDGICVIQPSKYKCSSATQMEEQ